MSDPPNIDTTQLPDTWQAYLPILTSLARTILAMLGGVGFTWAQTVNASQVQMWISAAMVVAAGLWGGWQKLQAQRALRKAAATPVVTAPPALPV